MTTSDQLQVSNLTTRRRTRASAPADLEDADRLISDLAVLVEAGLVAVQKQLGGPARYGVVPELWDAA